MCDHLMAQNGNLLVDAFTIRDLRERSGDLVRKEPWLSCFGGGILGSSPGVRVSAVEKVDKRHTAAL